MKAEVSQLVSQLAWRVWDGVAVSMQVHDGLVGLRVITDAVCAKIARWGTRRRRRACYRSTISG